MTKLVHALLVGLPAFSAEPTPEEPAARVVRLEVVAVAIYEACSQPPKGLPRRLCEGALVELGNEESRYALYVHAGRCSEGPAGARCDEGRSKGPWQQQRAACPRVWELPDGSEEQIKEAARCASVRLAGALHRCRSRNPNPLAGAFSGYAGASCTQPWADKRAARAVRFAARLGA